MCRTHRHASQKLATGRLLLRLLVESRLRESRGRRSFSQILLAVLLVFTVHDAEAGDAAPDTRAGERPGGAARVKIPAIARHAYMQPAGKLGDDGRFRFAIGEAVFSKLWVSAPASTKSSDGLGPLYNARSCSSCHVRGGRGRPPDMDVPDPVSFVLRLSVPPDTDQERTSLSSLRQTAIAEPTYGIQLQSRGIQGHSAEGQIHVSLEPIPHENHEVLPQPLMRPRYAVASPSYGALAADVMISPRMAPQLVGLGLIDAIPDAAIVAWADPEDVDGDGISGRVNRVWSIEHKMPKIGRFGWKATSPTLAQQVAEALATDIGLSSPLVRMPAGDCTHRQRTCLLARHGDGGTRPGPEVGDKLFALLVHFTRNVAVPVGRRDDPKAVIEGQVLFEKAGCHSCHRPSFTTGKSDDASHLADQVIWPYSDFLLHDMGELLADGRPDGLASGREWRTAPLWGIGLTGEVNGNTRYLHDGRARSIAEAILWHGGEARAAREFFVRLSPRRRKQLVQFVKSL